MNEELLRSLHNSLGGDKAGSYQSFVEEFNKSDELRQILWNKLGGEQAGTFESFLAEVGFSTPKPPEEKKPASAAEYFGSMFADPKTSTQSSFKQQDNETLGMPTFLKMVPGKKEEINKARKDQINSKLKEHSNIFYENNKLLNDPNTSELDRKAAVLKSLNASRVLSSEASSALKEIHGVDLADVDKLAYKVETLERKLAEINRSPFSKEERELRSSEVNSQLSEANKQLEEFTKYVGSLPEYQYLQESINSRKQLMEIADANFPQLKKTREETEQEQKESDEIAKSAEFSDELKTVGRWLGGKFLGTAHNFERSGLAFGRIMSDLVLSGDAEKKALISSLVREEELEGAAQALSPSSIQGRFNEEFVKTKDGTKVVFENGEPAFGRDKDGYKIELTEDQIKEANEKSGEGLEKDYNYGMLLNNFTQVAFDMIPTILVTRGLGTGSKLASALTVGSTTAAQAFGGYYFDALKKGASDEKAIGLALSKSILDGALENIGGLEARLSKIGMEESTLRLIKEDVIDGLRKGNIAQKDVLKYYASRVKETVTGGLKQGAGETIEEFSQSLEQGLMDMFVMNDRKTLEEMPKEALETFLISMGLGTGTSFLQESFAFKKNTSNDLMYNSILMAINNPERAAQIAKDMELSDTSAIDILRDDIEALGIKDDQKKLEALRLLSQRYALEKQSGKDKSGSVAAKVRSKKIKEIEAELNALGENKIYEPSEEEAQDVDSRPESETSELLNVLNKTVKKAEDKKEEQKPPVQTSIEFPSVESLEEDAEFNDFDPKQELSFEKEETPVDTPQEQVQEDVSEADYQTFVDTGTVKDEVLTSIASKVKSGNTQLTDKETAIFISNEDKVNKILQDQKQEEVKETTVEQTDSRVFKVGNKSFNIVPTSNSEMEGEISVDDKTYKAWKKRDEQEKRDADLIKKSNWSKEVKEKQLKSNALASAADKRRILGTRTASENKNIAKKEAGIQVGDKATVGGITYGVLGHTFGRIKVRTNEGNEFTVTKDSEIAKALKNQKKKTSTEPKGELVKNKEEFLRSKQKKERFEVDQVVNTRDGIPVGFEYDTDKVARERFDFSNMEKIGSGSDRDVYGIGDGKVLKVAKSARGLSQNMYEGDYLLSSEGLIPEIFERGLNYIIVAKVTRAKSSDNVPVFNEDGDVIGTTTFGQMLKELRNVIFTKDKYKVFFKYGLSDFLNYDLLYLDFVAIRNWGYVDGKPVHIDGGTLGGVKMFKKYEGVKNLKDSDFRYVYDRSRYIKRQFKDTDRNTKYQKEDSKSKKESDLKNRIEKVKSALKALVPDLKVKIHNTSEEYRHDYEKRHPNTSEEEKAMVKRSIASFEDSTKTIHLNLQRLKSSSLFHEGTHPLIDILETLNPGYTDVLFDELLEIEKELGIDGEYTQKFASQYPDDQKKNEAIVQFIAKVADGAIDLEDKSVFFQVKKFLSNIWNRILKALRKEVKDNIKTTDDLKNLAKTISQAFNTGKSLYIDEVVADDKTDLRLGLNGEVYQIAGKESYDKESFIPKDKAYQATQPFTNYTQALLNHDSVPQRNIYVRRLTNEDNSKRVLAVQPSSKYIIDRMRDSNQSSQAKVFDEYFDNLYSTVPGYDRSIDFMEVPFWIAEASGSIGNDLDMYVLRDPDEFSNFIKQSGYGKVMLSVLDANFEIVKKIVKDNPNTEFFLGGYVQGLSSKMKEFPNAHVFSTMQSGVDAAGYEYNKKYDYSLFNGMEVVPRLKMSDGCLYKCAFCTVEKKITTMSQKTIDEQVESLKDLNMKYVYLDDKTFGQADNYEYIIDVGNKLASSVPNFDGFIIQTTSATVKKMEQKDPDFFKKARIKIVEIGIESNNDSVLRGLRKPNSEKLNAEAVKILRKHGLKFVPNLIIGFENETEQTYENTIKFLEENSDIISHANIYNLAVYEGTELDDKMNARLEADRNENVLEKSFHSDPALHERYYYRIYDVVNSIMEKNNSKNTERFELEEDSKSKAIDNIKNYFTRKNIPKTPDKVDKFYSKFESDLESAGITKDDINRSFNPPPGVDDTAGTTTGTETSETVRPGVDPQAVDEKFLEGVAKDVQNVQDADFEKLVSKYHANNEKLAEALNPDLEGLTEAERSEAIDEKKYLITTHERMLSSMDKFFSLLKGRFQDNYLEKSYELFSSIATKDSLNAAIFGIRLKELIETKLKDPSLSTEEAISLRLLRKKLTRDLQVKGKEIARVLSLYRRIKNNANTIRTNVIANTRGAKKRAEEIESELEKAEDIDENEGFKSPKPSKDSDSKPKTKKIPAIDALTKAKAKIKGVSDSKTIVAKFRELTNKRPC